MQKLIEIPTAFEPEAKRVYRLVIQREALALGSSGVGCVVAANPKSPKGGRGPSEARSGGTPQWCCVMVDPIILTSHHDNRFYLVPAVGAV